MSVDRNLNDDQWLRLYLDESLDEEGMAFVEKRLRHDPDFLAKLDALKSQVVDPAVHGVAMAWLAGRLTCASRSEWTQHFSGLLPPDRSDYLNFHLEVIECPFCCANVADLKHRHKRTGTAEQIASRSARAAGWPGTKPKSP